MKLDWVRAIQERRREIAAEIRDHEQAIAAIKASHVKRQAEIDLALAELPIDP